MRQLPLLASEEAASEDQSYTLGSKVYDLIIKDHNGDDSHAQFSMELHLMGIEEALI